MAENFIQVPPQSTGLKVRTQEVTANSQTVEMENVVISDPTTVANMMAVTAAGAAKVDGSAVTQPVSGTVSLTAGQAVELLDSGGTNKASISAGGAVKVDGSAVTQPVSGTVTANIGTTNGLALDATVSSVQPRRIQDGAGATLATVTAGNALKVDGSAVTQPVSGTITANAGSGTFNIQANASVNLAQENGTATSTGNGATNAGDARVNIANDNTAIANWGQGATGSAVPSGAVYAGTRATTTLPSAATAGNLVGGMADVDGRSIVRASGPRERLVTNNLTLSATGSNTLIGAGAASIFRDLTFLQASNTSATNVRIDVSDGTRTYSWFLAANGGGFNINFNPPLAAASSATAWTAAISAAVTDVRVGAQAVETH